MEKRDYSNLPEHLPHGKLAFNDSTNELFIGAGENAPLQKVTNKEIEDELRVASIDYSGEHHANLKDSMDANVDFVMGEFNSVQMTGEYITAQNTIPRHVKRAELKGHTEVNVIQEPSGEDVVLPYSFEEGEYGTINDTHENGRVEVEVKGRTLVNLASPHEEREISFIYRWQAYALTNDIIPTGLIEGELIYMSLEVNIHEINIETPAFSCQSMRGTGGYARMVKNFDELEQLPKNTWVKISTIREVRANESLDQYLLQLGIIGEHPTESGEQVARASFRKPIWINLTKMFGKGKEPTLSECDSIPYFEGMATVQAPTVQTVGKNLFDGEVVNNKNIDVSTGEVGIGNRTIPINFISVKPNITYTLTRPVSGGNVGIRYYSKNQNYLSTKSFVPAYGIATFTFTTPIDCYFLKFIDEANTLNSNYQIEEGSTATTYESHQSSSFTLPEEIVLRGFPNGVCDTYNTKTKEHTQRIGEIVLDGVNYKCIKITTNGDETKRFDINFTFEKFVGANGWIDLTKMNASVICDKAICNSNGHSVHPNKNAIASFNGILVLFIEDNTILTIEKANEWLQQNPITVQYELATPIVTEIDLPSLKAYNTVTHLSSTVGESSLVPTLASDNTISHPAILKPNTKYSIITNPTLNGHTSTPISCNLGGASIEILPDSGNCHLITTPNDLAHSNLTFTDGDGHKLCGGVMLLGGDKTGMMFNYFEGMKSVENPIVKVTNGLDELTESYKSNALTIPTKLSLRSLPNGVCDTLDLITGEYVQNVMNIILDGTEPWNMYGLKDEYPDVIGFHTPLSEWGNRRGNSYFYLGSLPPTTSDLLPGNITSNTECITVAQIQYVKVSIYRNKLNSLNANGFKQWLSENPITLQYELAEPITTKLDLQWEDDKLFAYDGTTHFLVDIEEGHLYPVFDVDVPVNLSAEFSRLRAEKEQLQRDKDRLENQLSLVTYHKDTLYSNVQSLQTENSQLKTQAEDLQVKSNVLELKSGELEKCTTRLTQSTAHLSEGLQFVDSTREKGDLELLSSDFDLDFRLMEIEFALDLTLPAQFRTKEVRNMARTPYEMAKTLILGGKYDREDMEFKLGRYLKRGQITQEQHDELLALMEANDLM